MKTFVLVSIINKAIECRLSGLVNKRRTMGRLVIGF